MTAYILNQCDEWKSYSSFTLYGVFTNKAILFKAIRKLIKERKVKSHLPLPLKYYSLKDLNDLIDFLFIDSVELNEIQD